MLIELASECGGGGGLLGALLGSAASSAGTSRPRKARVANLDPPRPTPSPERRPETIQLDGLGESDDSAIDVSRQTRAGPPESELNAHMKNMDVQTAALLQHLTPQQQQQSRSDTAGVRSVLQVKPQISSLVLDDKDNDVDEFIDELGSTIGLANDGLGMADREKLRVLTARQLPAAVAEAGLLGRHAGGAPCGDPRIRSWRRVRPGHRAPARVPRGRDREADARPTSGKRWSLASSRAAVPAAV